MVMDNAAGELTAAMVSVRVVVDVVMQLTKRSTFSYPTSLHQEP